MCYFLHQSPSASPFWSNLCPVPDLYDDIAAFYSKMFPSSITVGCCTRGEQMRGEEGRFAWVTKNHSRIRVGYYYVTRFNVSTQGPMLGPSTAHCNVGD